jgi:hypothetical protein
MIQDALVKAGVPEVRGVWAHEAGVGAASQRCPIRSGRSPIGRAPPRQDHRRRDGAMTTISVEASQSPTEDLPA